MYLLILIPFLVQMFVISFDECYFHLKRGLPLWERIGHPLDTFTVILCLAFVVFVPFSDTAAKWYIGLSVFSCLMVTKDEWVHKHHCVASENWLHALLFINHPIVLTSVGMIWWASAASAPIWIKSWLNQPEELYVLLVMQTSAIIVFFLYQIIYWNFVWKEKKTESL